MYVSLHEVCDRWCWSSVELVLTSARWWKFSLRWRSGWCGVAGVHRRKSSLPPFCRHKFESDVWSQALSAPLKGCFQEHINEVLLVQCVEASKKRVVGGIHVYWHLFKPLTNGEVFTHLLSGKGEVLLMHPHFKDFCDVIGWKWRWMSHSQLGMKIKGILSSVWFDPSPRRREGALRHLGAFSFVWGAKVRLFDFHVGLFRKQSYVLLIHFQQ